MPAPEPRQYSVIMFQEAHKMSYSLRQLWNLHTHALYTRIQFYLMGRNRGFLFQTCVRDDAVSYTPRSACSTDTILGGENIFITHIDWRKRGIWPFHEFLVVYVQEKRTDGVKPRKSVIMIDRDVSNLVAEKDSEVPPRRDPCLIFTQHGKEIPPPAAKPSSYILNENPCKISKTLATVDHLTFSMDGTDSFIWGQWPSDVCRSLSIKGTHVSVTQLAVLTRVVHDHCRSYKLLEYQSHWFAEVIYTTIKGMVQASVASSSSGSCRDNVRSSPHQHGYFEIAGVGCEVRRGRDDTSRLIAEEYQVAWSECKEEIMSAKDIRRRAREPKITASEDRIETVQAKADAAQAQVEQERLEKEKAQAQVEELMARLAKYEPMSLGHP